MNVTDFLSPDNVAIEGRDFNKVQLVKEIASRAAARLHLPPAQIAEALLKREKLGSTGMGGGVAIPHARVRDLKKPWGMLLRLVKPIDFDAVDGSPVDIVFLLLSPADPEGDQLSALACIARTLSDQNVALEIRAAEDGAAIHRALTVARGPAPPATSVDLQTVSSP